VKSQSRCARQSTSNSGNSHHASRNSHCAVSWSKAHLHRTAHSSLFGTKVKIKIYSSQTLAEQEQAQHVGQPDRLRDTTRLSGMCTAQFRARATGLTIRSSRARFAVSSRFHSPDAGRLNSGVRAHCQVLRRPTKMYRNPLLFLAVLALSACSGNGPGRLEGTWNGTKPFPVTVTFRETSP